MLTDGVQSPPKNNNIGFCMIMKILKGFGIAFLSLIAVFIVIAAWAGFKSASYNETAVPYMKQVIPAISTWQVDAMKLHLTPSVLESIDEKDLTTIVNGLAKMGQLIELGEFEFSKVTSQALTGGNSGTFVTYTVPAKYENGDATITVTLKESGDSFTVYHFNLNSLALLQ